jgi:ketosteroid isomerase-like protein
MRESSKRGAQLLAWQRYEVRDAIEHGDTAIMRVTWTAEIAQNIGPFRAGQKLTAHLAQFVTCRDGRITHLETYDCYEPFAPQVAG